MTSTQVAGTVRSPLVGGVTYYLPKRMLSLDIWEIKGALADPVIQDPADRAARSGAKQPKRPGRYFATLGELQTVPDRNYLMRLTQNPSASFHDRVQVQMTEAGLLTTVSSIVTDESPKIVAQLARLGKLAAGVPDTAKTTRVSGQDEGPTFHLVARVVVDPADPHDVREQLDRFEIDLEASPMTVGTDARCALTPSAVCEPVCNQSGVCYRPVIPYSVRVKPAGFVLPAQGLKPASVAWLPEGVQEIMMLPNRSPVVCLPIERGAFVTSKFKVTFAEGLLTEMSSDKPSEILGFMSIPLDIARAIVSVPGELLQVKVTNYGNVAKAAESEKKAFETLQALEKAQRGE